MNQMIMDEYLQGASLKGYEVFGAHLTKEGRKHGVKFTVYAPNAEKVTLIGDFNNWKGSEMEQLPSGVWTTFAHGVREGAIYKYRIHTKDGEVHDRIDPFAVYSEVRPNTASIVYSLDKFEWSDEEWMSKRSRNHERPMNVYEVHLGSWRVKEKPKAKEISEEIKEISEENLQEKLKGSTKNKLKEQSKDDAEENPKEQLKKEPEKDNFYTYKEMEELLIPYVKKMGYTHIELLPLTEYPFDGSWGYQVTGYFSATSRYGTPEELMSFINSCHKAGIGVILDFVPVHFVSDFYALHQYDGGFLYESQYEHDRYSEWGTLLFDFSKPHVLSFLKSSIDFWITKYHIDGIRYDAVSNLIYNKGRGDMGINEPGVWFLKNANYAIREKHPQVMLIAEDSSSYQRVTSPIAYGGLGFDYKWGLGWMHDTLDYLSIHADYRSSNHNKLTFSMLYFYTENFILPFSHDEVVHGKRTIIDKLEGSYEQKFAQAKSLYLYMFTHPGKKLNFMGNEIGEFREWDEKTELGWNILKYPIHISFHHYMMKLNHMYLEQSALYKADYHPLGFQWLDVHNAERSVYAYRRDDMVGSTVYVVINFSNRQYDDYKLRVEEMGYYDELMNTDAKEFGGAGYVNDGFLLPEVYGEQQFLNIKLAPFSSCIFKISNKPYKIASKSAEDEVDKKTVNKKTANKKSVSKKAEAISVSDDKNDIEK